MPFRPNTTVPLDPLPGGRESFGTAKYGAQFATPRPAIFPHRRGGQAVRCPLQSGEAPLYKFLMQTEILLLKLRSLPLKLWAYIYAFSRCASLTHVLIRPRPRKIFCLPEFSAAHPWVFK